MTASRPVCIDAAALAELVPAHRAVEALRKALVTAAEQPHIPPRTVVEGAGNYLLFMPAVADAYLGAKVAAVAPTNNARGLPRVQGVYILFNGDSCAPLAVVDAAALTALRAAATTALAIERLVSPGELSVVLFGSGAQAWAHATVLSSVYPMAAMRVVSKHADRAASFVERCADQHAEVRVGTSHDVAEADLVVCCTDSPTPLFDGGLVGDHACVAAVGAHTRDCRELDGHLLRRAGTVVVEDVANALREAGDVVMAIDECRLDRSSLVGLTELVCGDAGVDMDAPRVFKGVGRGWQDLAVAAAAYERA